MSSVPSHTGLYTIMDIFYTPNCTQTDPDLVDNCRPFQQDCPCTITAGINNLTLELRIAITVWKIIGSALNKGHFARIIGPNSVRCRGVPLLSITQCVFTSVL